MKLPWDEKGKATSVVVYKKTKNASKHYMIVTDNHIDIINNNRATKPIVDHKYHIVALGIGHSFIESWGETYKVKKPQIISKYK